MVDVHQPGDYKIVLGDSLRTDSADTQSFLGVKYNWIPKGGLDGSSGTLKASGNNLNLTYENDGHKFNYSGWLADQPDRGSQLALFYDRDKSVFVLEKIEASAEVNIKSSTDVSSDQIKRHVQLQQPLITQRSRGGVGAAGDSFDGSDEDSPDASNPFDYRHFVGEAREATDKTSHPAGGSRTPLPGARTPMSGLSSPLLGAGHHPLQSTTPQFGPIEIVDSTHKEMNEYPDRRRQKATKATKSKSRVAARKTQPTITKPRATAQAKRPQVLSQERIVDSDSDDDASADMSDHPSPAPAPASAPSAKKSSKPHNRNISTTSVPSIVNDDGGLEIDTGSPPPTSRKRAYKIDPEAFRSQTGTPRPGHSSNTNRFQPSGRPVSRDSNADIEMHDADEEEEENEDMKYLQDADDDSSGDRDGDVEELILNDGGPPLKSPSPPPAPAPEPEPIKAPKPTKRRQSSTIKRHKPARSPSPPRHQQQQQQDPEDDDGGLVDELERAFLRDQEELERRMLEDNDDDEDEDGGIGLGIGIGTSGGQDEHESEISEEE